MKSCLCSADTLLTMSNQKELKKITGTKPSSWYSQEKEAHFLYFSCAKLHPEAWQQRGSRPEGKLLRKRVDNRKVQQNGTGGGQRCCTPVHKAVPEAKSNVGFCDLWTKRWRHSLTQANGFFTSMSKKQDSHSTAVLNSFLNLQKERHWTDIVWHQSLSPEITYMANGGLIKRSEKEIEGFLLSLHGSWIRSSKCGLSHRCIFIYTDDVILIASIHTTTSK